jgi:hypothetical protein
MFFLFKPLNSNNMRKIMMIILVSFLGTLGTVYAQQPAVMASDTKGWHKIGETTVSFQKEKDEILVVGADKFAKIKFKVENEPINLQSLEVYYDKGDKQDIMVNMPVKAPGESRVIDLNGGERDLKKIVFVYKTMANNQDKKAHVEVWGLKTNADKKNQ